MKKLALLLASFPFIFGSVAAQQAPREYVNPVIESLSIALRVCEVELAELRARELAVREELEQLQAEFAPTHADVVALSEVLEMLLGQIALEEARRTELVRQIADSSMTSEIR